MVWVNGWVLILLGAVIILISLWLVGSQSQRTAYHRPVWSWKDGLILVVAIFMLAICLLPVSGLNRESLYYEPYPTLTMPPFSPLLGVAMLGLVFPGLLVSRRNLGSGE
jgi:energy-coupling factor transport system permease protein